MNSTEIENSKTKVIAHPGKEQRNSKIVQRALVYSSAFLLTGLIGVTWVALGDWIFSK